jgi:hypothetical protein
VVVSQKLEVLLVLQSFLDMEGEWQKIEDFLVGLFVVVGHCIEESFFVADDVVVYKMILHLLLSDF